jgi:hypothetical protein
VNFSASFVKEEKPSDAAIPTFKRHDLNPIMTSFQTVPAFVHYGGWDETTRKHPAMKMMETITNEFDNSNQLNRNWYAADTSFQKADGVEYHGVDEVIAAVEEGYAPFTSHYHEPQSMMCIETDDGYKMLGWAKLFGNLRGAPAAGENKVKDRLGREWDTVILGGYSHWYVKDEKAKNGLGMAIKSGEVRADGSTLMKVMLRRGLISAESLGL